ncbi:MAG: hypothetical protein HYS25_13830 [Ignavibacteriales bacterium]|nr:hypothetical protein [Ignavibacteriales bacterium]
MSKEVKAGSAYIEIGAKADRIRSDSKIVESVLKSEMSRIEKNVARVRPAVENALVKKSIKEIEILYTSLKRQLETKIKMNADLGSIQRTQGVLKVVEDQLKDIKQQAGRSEQAVGGFFSRFSNLGSLIGFAGGTAAIGVLGKEAIMTAADLEVLRVNFQGTGEDLENFRRATAGTVSDANLIQLSNQAIDLGISLREQAILFSLAEDAADKYGTSVEDGFQKIIAASEGNERGLRSLGIQRQVYKSILESLAKVHGDEIGDLDAETQKQIRLEAIIRASGVTLDEVKNKTKDTKDKLESIGITARKILSDIGAMIIITFDQIATRTESSWNMIKNKFGGGDIPPTTQLNTDQADQLGREALKNINKGYYVPGQGFKEFAKENKKDLEVWTQKGKTVGQVEKRVELLVSLQKNLVLGSLEWLKNWREIERLQKALQPPKEKKPFTPVGDIQALGAMTVPDKKKKSLSFVRQSDESPLNNSFLREVSESNVIEEWIRQSEAASVAFDTMFDAFAEGMTQIRIRTSATATAVEQSFANMANIVIAEIERIIAKWLVLNLFSAIGGGGGVNLFGMLAKNRVTAPVSGGGTSFGLPALSTAGVITSIRGGSSFSDGNIVGALKNIERRLISLEHTTIKVGKTVPGLYLDSKQLTTKVTQQQNNLNKRNVRIGS